MLSTSSAQKTDLKKLCETMTQGFVCKNNMSKYNITSKELCAIELAGIQNMSCLKVLTIN